MLVLTRYPGESISVFTESGEEVQFIYLRSIPVNEKVSKAKIGIIAPASINILRTELTIKPEESE